jgi:hypothetical protein
MSARQPAFRRGVSKELVTVQRAIARGLLALVVGVMCVPVQAQAKAYINPWGGVVFGNDAASPGFRSFGVSFGDAGHGLVGTETNIGISPGFFGSRVENYVVDIMGGFTVGPTFATKGGRDIRPYGVIEGGTVRTSIDGGTVGLKRNDIGISVGGGATIQVNDMLSVRGDVRYFKEIGADEAANSLNVNLGDFHYWRAAIGITLH